MMRRLSSGWLAPLVLVALLLPGCDDSSDAAAETSLAPATTTTDLPTTTISNDATTTTTTSPTSTTMASNDTSSPPDYTSDAVQASIEAIEVLEPESWNPILSETNARPAPAPATCPTFSIPEAEDRAGSPVFPYKGSITGTSQAVFDQHAGHVIYHDSERTWAFDICTNIWTRLSDHDERKPSGWLGAPVYDIDSDTTVSFGYVRGIFDTDTGSWTEHAYPDGIEGISAAVYDPVSGLIVTTTWQDRLLRAYDVDTDTWTEIGTIPTPSDRRGSAPLSVLGYLPALDRFIVTTHRAHVTALVDPRTGTTSFIATLSPGYPPAYGGAAGQTTDSVIVDIEQLNLPLCEFNAQTLTWNTCHTLPTEATNSEPDATRPSQPATFEVSTIVEDTTNNRLLFLGFRDYRAPHIWASDQTTDHWTRIPFTISN